MTPPFYPARPVNGGPLNLARPKIGRWLYEPKFNGWRVLVHVPTLACYNRHGESLSIAKEFGPALADLQHGLALAQSRADSSARLSAPEAEWADCEGLERRHNRGRGSLIVLDLPMLNLPLENRGHVMRGIFAPAIDHCASHDAVYSVPQFTDGLGVYAEYAQFNRDLGIPFYEGVVAKRADSAYPLHAGHAEKETALWVKHRWRW